MSQEPELDIEAQPSPSMPWYNVWIDALFQPSIKTYEDLAHSPDAAGEKPYLWMALSTLVGVTPVALLQLLCQLSSLLTLASPDGGAGAIAGTIVLLVVCFGLLVIPVALVALWFVIGTGVTHLLARAFGGKGTYRQLAYVFAAYAAPMGIAIMLLNMIPCVGPMIVFFLGIYGTVLSVIAVEAVHQIGWGAAIGTAAARVLSFFVLILLIVFGPAVLLAYPGM